MRRPLLLAALLAVATAFPAVAQQAYPSRTIRIISPFAAGGGNAGIENTKKCIHRKQNIENNEM